MFQLERLDEGTASAGTLFSTSARSIVSQKTIPRDISLLELHDEKLVAMWSQGSRLMKVSDMSG